MTRAKYAVLLVAGLAAVVLSNGRFATPIAAWVAPALLLSFLNGRSRMRRLALLTPALVAAYFVMWRGYVPAPGWLYYAIAGGYGLAYALPYWVEAALAPIERRSWTGTLLFPCSWVAVELLLERLTPYGSWISIAYSQVEFPALRQSASLFGLATITFFVTWTGAMIAWVAATRERDARRTRSGIVAWTLVAASLLVYGELRLRRTGAPVTHVRAALLTAEPELRAVFERELAPVLESGASGGAALVPLLDAAKAVTDELVAATRREARAGARLVVWSETAARIRGEDEADFLESMRVLASEEEVHLGVGVGVWSPRAVPPLRNVFFAVGPEGWLDWTYEKAHPVVGPESPWVAAGPGVLPSWETSLGKLTAAICHDLDFPELIRQSSRLGASILIGPSDDWTDIDWFHANMARMRAVENGVVLVRPAYGVSLVADPEGRVLASRNTFESGRRSEPAESAALVASVPVRRRATLYGVIGPGFSWLCAAALVGALASRARSGAPRVMTQARSGVGARSR